MPHKLRRPPASDEAASSRKGSTFKVNLGAPDIFPTRSIGRGETFARLQRQHRAHHEDPGINGLESRITAGIIVQ